MTYQTTNIYRYLIFLQKYFLGDLMKFRQLCIEAELEENNIASVKDDSTNTTPVITTTRNPYSFDFMFGAAVVARSTIPHTATLFAIIDILGFLTRTGTDYANTKLNFITFFNDPSIQLTPAELPVLVKVYRHGMTHSYFPKLNMEISYHSSNPNGVMFFKNSHGDVVLNVNHLVLVVTTRLEHIINDTSLYPNMDMQYNLLVQKYESDCRNEIDVLKAQL